jgi:hypothetical protein
MARGRQGRSAEITLMHHPPMVMAEVLPAIKGEGQLTDGGAGQGNGAGSGAAAPPKGIAAKGEP